MTTSTETEQEARAALEGYYAIEARGYAMAEKLSRLAGSYSFSLVEDDKVYFEYYAHGDVQGHVEPLSALWDAGWDTEMDTRIAAYNGDMAAKKKIVAAKVEAAEREALAKLKAKYGE